LRGIRRDVRAAVYVAPVGVEQEIERLRTAMGDAGRAAWEQFAAGDPRARPGFERTAAAARELRAYVSALNTEWDPELRRGAIQSAHWWERAAEAKLAR
jgi:hypothetical protein